MKVILMGKKGISSAVLPKEVRGQYKIVEMRDGKAEGLEIRIEAKDGKWMINQDDSMQIQAEAKTEEDMMELQENGIYFITCQSSADKLTLFVEPDDQRSNIYCKYKIPEDGSIVIGNAGRGTIRYGNKAMQQELGISIHYKGQDIVIKNEMSHVPNSVSEIYLNGNYMTQAIGHYGDVLYVYGLKVVLGRNFVSINNPGGFVDCKLEPFSLPKKVEGSKTSHYVRKEKLFSSSPRKDRKIIAPVIRVEAPPRQESDQETPLYLTMGPAVTMAGASGVTGLYSVMNVLQNNGNILQAMPSIVMVASMMLGSIVWPFFSRRYTKRKRLQKDAENYEKYQEYIKGLYKEITDLSVKQKESLLANFPTLLQCENRILGRESTMWERSVGDSDFLELNLGQGTDDLKCQITYPTENIFESPAEALKLLHGFKATDKQLQNVPITFSFAEHSLVGMIGNRTLTKQLLYGLLVQMVALHDYEDLKVGVIYDKSEPEWECFKWLPHTWSDDKMVKFMANSSDDVNVLNNYFELVSSIRENESEEDMMYEQPHYVLILADQKLAEKSEVIKKLYKQRKNVKITLIILANDQKSLPKTCKHVLEVKEDGVVINDYTVDVVEKHTDASMFYKGNPEAVFKSLADVKMEANSQKTTLPEQVTMFEFLGAGKPEHIDFLSQWKKSNPTKSLAAPIGVDNDGNVIYLDVHEKAHGPHGLIAGSTGSGKSEFVITYITMMVLNYSPEEVAFILIDFKGGGMADVFKNLPHLAGTITNLDGNELKRSMVAIESEMERRQLLFKEVSKELKISNIDIYRYQKLYREGKVKEPLPHLMIISDEFAELKQQQSDFLQQLIRVARIGRSLGVHLILATQKPDGVVDDQIKSNIKFKVCLRVQDKMDSISMIDRPDAATIRVPGRFYLQVGMNELFELGQSPFSGAEYEASENAVVRQDDSVIIFNGLERLSVKPARKSKMKSSGKEIDALLSYMTEVCRENNYTTRVLWRDRLPGPKKQKEKVYSDAQRPYALNPVIGKYDDIRNRCYRNLTVPITEEGNVLVYGVAGSGTLDFFNAMIYAMLKQHMSDELQLYLMDYEAGSLKAFSQAPQVAGFYRGYEEEKIDRMLDRISSEIERRKNLFSRYGGSYQNYIQNSGKKEPNIVIMLLNCAAAFESNESYDRMQKITQMSRECVQYGVYFVISAIDERSVRGQLAANFKQVFVLQQNKEDAYREILGKTGGLVPMPCLGRGIFKREQNVYEFQTEIIFEEEEEPYLAIENFCREQRVLHGLEGPAAEQSKSKLLTEGDFAEEWEEASVSKIPLGTDLAGEKVLLDLRSAVKHLVVIEEDSENWKADRLVENIQRIYPETQIMEAAKNEEETEALIQVVDDLYELMYERAELGVAAKERGEAVPVFEDKILIIKNYDALVRSLPGDQVMNLEMMLQGLTCGYHIHFVVINHAQEMKEFYNAEMWKAPVKQGIWLGNELRGAEIFGGKEKETLLNGSDAGIDVLYSDGKAVEFQMLGRGDING